MKKMCYTTCLNAQISEIMNFTSKLAVTFHVTIAYLKRNSEIKDRFLKKILTQKKNVLFGSKTGDQLIHG